MRPTTSSPTATHVLVSLLAAAGLAAPTAGCSGTEPDGPGCQGAKCDDTDDSSNNGPALDYLSYEVLFTNPLCEVYSYADPVPTADGSEMLTHKPKNVYCKTEDRPASGAREQSPQYRILEWLAEAGSGDEVFLAYLSFSDREILDGLCEAVDAGAEVTFVLDRKNGGSVVLEKVGEDDDGEAIMEPVLVQTDEFGAPILDGQGEPIPDPDGRPLLTGRALDLARCGGRVLTRGHRGYVDPDDFRNNDDIGYAHNKIIMINPHQTGPADADADYARLVFSSGNMSSGTTVHHENWHFITARRDSYFMQSHRCLVDAQLDDEAVSGRTAYTTYMNECRDAIDAAQEKDIRAFFIPNGNVNDDAGNLVRYGDSSTATFFMTSAIGRARTIDMGAHRFFYSSMLNALKKRLESDPEVRIRLIADDDLYWLKPYNDTPGEMVGNNLEGEAQWVEDLYAAAGLELYQETEDAGFRVHFMETDHGGHKLHHNKYLLFKGMSDLPSAMPQAEDAVLCGAANLTSAGFWTNFENIYYIAVPEVVQAFDDQYRRFWDGEKLPGDTQDAPMATAPGRMPATNVLP